MRLYFEPAFYKYNVDMVFNGHVHAYERTPPVFAWQPNTCGTIHITMGDGGNIEGLYKQFVDQTQNVSSGPGGAVTAVTPAYCSNTTKFAPASYQPTYSGKGYVDPNTPFCFASQPPWSDFREPAFGHGLFTVHNETTAEWRWNRNTDDAGVYIDHIFIEKNPSNTCNGMVVRGTQSAANAGAKGMGR